VTDAGHKLAASSVRFDKVQISKIKRRMIFLIAFETASIK
jgi:hypothetical protein